MFADDFFGLAHGVGLYGSHKRFRVGGAADAVESAALAVLIYPLFCCFHVVVAFLLNQAPDPTRAMRRFVIREV